MKKKLFTLLLALVAIATTGRAQNTNAQVVIERKYKVHHGGDYHEPQIILDFGNNQILHVGYLNMNWWGDYNHTMHGIYIIAAGNDWALPEGDENVWHIAPVLADQWVTEKLIIDINGKVQYYMNGKFMGEKTFSGINLSNAKKVRFSASPFGWWPGHSHYMDDFSLKTPFTSVSDNFNDGVLDTNIWQTPVNPDGVREEDGILKMEMLRTDQDFILRSKSFPLFEDTPPTQGMAIDLGLPSGTLWASCNVGANSPEEYGDHFAWGETQPKNDYSWGTYKWCNGSPYSLTKYCNNSSLGNNGFADNKIELELEDDAANVNWGGDWRMPSLDQIKELVNNCEWEWTTLNGVNGRRITGPNGNSIFLPAAGWRSSTSLYDEGTGGGYWSRMISTLIPYGAYDMSLESNDVDWDDYCGSRRDGQVIRPVTVKSDQPTDYLLGDANGDGKVTVADYTAIAHYIMGKAPANFNEKAADVNGDGKINVADYTAAAHLILYGTVEKPK